MSEKEPRRIFCAIDIRTHNAIDVSPPDHESQRDSALIYSFDIIRRPRDRVRNAWVNAHGSKERASILDAWCAGAQKHTEPDDSKDGHADVAQSTLLCAVREPSYEHRDDCSEGVGRDTKEVCSGGGVAELFYDSGEEEGEGVERAVCAHVDDGEHECFPVLDGLPEILHLELFVVRGRLLVGAEAAQNAGAVVRGQEGGFGGEVVDHPVGDDADDDGG